jgi:hypothetical protein
MDAPPVCPIGDISKEHRYGQMLPPPIPPRARALAMTPTPLILPRLRTLPPPMGYQDIHQRYYELKNSLATQVYAGIPAAERIAVRFIMKAWIATRASHFTVGVHFHIYFVFPAPQ